MEEKGEHMSYTVKFLSNAEFDSLPYKHVKESFGCADQKTMTAYVRQTGIKPLDMFVTEHEIEELIAKVSPHEEDGIRYKKGKDIFKTIGGPLLGIGSALFPPLAPFAAAIGGLGGLGLGMGLGKGKFGQRLMGAIPGALGGATAGGIGNWFTAGAGAGAGAGNGGVLGNAIKSGFQIGSQGAESGSLGLSGLGGLSGLKEYGNQILQPSLTEKLTGGFGGAFSSGSAGAGAKAATGGGLWSNITSGIGKLFNGGGEGGSGAGFNLGKTALGAGIPLIGNMFAPSAKEASKFNAMDSGIFKDVYNRIKQGTTLKMTDDQRNAVLYNYNQQRDQELERLKGQFKALRPGADYLNDSDYQTSVNQINQDYDQMASRDISLMEMGFTQEQTNQLSQLANLEVWQLAQTAGISAQEAMEFKQMLANLGTAVMTM